MELRDGRPTPEAQLVDQEASAILHREIRRLPPLLRNVLVMRDLEEMPMDDVAGQLGISLVAAKSRLLRARTELRHRLERFTDAIQAPCPAASGRSARM
jgi:RNA polymerase sigma-70 factor (ECF subfamily)